MHISEMSIKRRTYWIDEIVKLSGHFGFDSTRVEAELTQEILKNGVQALLDHLRLCGAIPESYGHDSSEEKLYSKYTDALISAAYSYIGMRSVVLAERADAADVEVVAKSFSFVADAKVFRLSRTAKNQKDFKIQAMDGWKRGKPFAMVVCPLYQLPTKSSQIYEQAAARNVCVFSYSHLSILVQLVDIVGKDRTVDLLHEIFKSVQALHASKDATMYWQAVNRTMLGFDAKIPELWKLEKVITLEGVNISKAIALTYLASERERIMHLSHDEAIRHLLDMNKIQSRMKTIEAVSDNYIMSII
ncbi:MAG: HindIII family type II restriction endonuclease [Rhodobacter sp.]|nr:HindIII family type II restriction endonuclease [Rhodobacter sp.]